MLNKKSTSCFFLSPGWESQLLETGFLAIFLCPIWNVASVPKHTPTSWIVLMAYRWLIFRIMIGAVKYILVHSKQ